MARTRSSAASRDRPSKSGALTFQELIGRKSWKPLPAVAVLAGEAEFFRREVERRFTRELFGDAPSPSIQRFDAALGVEGLLARVLDDLRTLSILSEARLVVVDAAAEFLEAYREDLEPHLDSGFAGGHLILHLDRSLDGRTRFAKSAAEKGWVVECRQPFDRPPPWKTGVPPWQNELSEWIASWAARKGLEIDLQTAFFLQERVGADLGVIDECLEKVRTFLGPGRRRADEAAIEAVTGDVREDSIFDLVEAWVARDRARALAIAERLFDGGYRPARGSPIFDAGAISSMFIGAAAARLRPLRRAHALQAAGEGPERWLELRLVARPFLERFRRELAAMPPERIERAFERLLALDRKIKTGADPRAGLEIFLAGS